MPFLVMRAKTRKQKEREEVGANVQKDNSEILKLKNAQEWKFLENVARKNFRVSKYESWYKNRHLLLLFYTS